jgi:predicted transcriptional regulator
MAIVAETPTNDEVMQAARALGKPEFTRNEIARQLGVRGSQMREGFRAAKKAGQLQKARDDKDGTRYFRLADS